MPTALHNADRHSLPGRHQRLRCPDLVAEYGKVGLDGVCDCVACSVVGLSWPVASTTHGALPTRGHRLRWLKLSKTHKGRPKAVEPHRRPFVGPELGQAHGFHSCVLTLGRGSRSSAGRASTPGREAVGGYEQGSGRLRPLPTSPTLLFTAAIRSTYRNSFPLPECPRSPLRTRSPIRETRRAHRPGTRSPGAHFQIHRLPHEAAHQALRSRLVVVALGQGQYSSCCSFGDIGGRTSFTARLLVRSRAIYRSPSHTPSL